MGDEKKNGGGQSSDGLVRWTALLTYEAAAEYCDVPKRTIMRWVHQGRIQVARLSGRSVRIRVEDLEAFVADQVC